MSKKIEVTLSIPPDALLSKARMSAQSNGVKLVGDELSGKFSGKGIEGAYRIDGNKMAITIASKPLLMPWPVIEAAVKSFFA